MTITLEGLTKQQSQIADIGGGMAFGATFAASAFGVAMLYVGLGIGYFF